MFPFLRLARLRSQRLIPSAAPALFGAEVFLIGADAGSSLVAFSLPCSRRRQMRKAGAALDRMQDQMEAEEDGVTLGSIFRWLGFGK